MPPHDLEKLCRTLSYDRKTVVILRPGIALVLYSSADLATVMKATSDVLREYLDFNPPGAIGTTYEPSPDEDEYTPGQWVVFDSGARRQLSRELQAGPAQDDRGYRFVLSTGDGGPAGNYGVRFAGTNFEVETDDPNSMSVLRLEFPWNVLDTVPVELLVDLFERLAALFPFGSGHAGMSFIHTISYVPEAQDEIDKLLPRFLGFDSAHEAARLEMRHKSPPAHWLNFLDDELVKALGGEEKLRSELDGCPLKRLGGGLVIRAAKYPPVVDVNRGGLDIGQLPTVARALKPIRFDEGLFAGLQDADEGEEWLQRFDNLTSRDWDNG